MQMPTPRKTDAEHRLQSTRSQSKEPEAPAVAPGRPKFPKDLTPASRVVFKRIAGLLEKRKHITEGDIELIRLYSLLYVRHAKALGKLDAEGEVRVYVRLDSNGTAHDQEKPNYWLKIAETAERSMVVILDRLGLTPHNRSKVKPTADDKNKAADPMEEFLASRTPGRAASETAIEDDDLEGLVN